MFNWGASRWEVDGCGQNGVFELDIALVGDSDVCTLYQAQVQASREVTDRAERRKKKGGGLILDLKGKLADV